LNCLVHEFKKKLLNSISFESGFGNNLLENLKCQVEQMHELDRYCSLLFDEIKLSEGLFYDKSRQRLLGMKILIIWEGFQNVPTML
jgi:hypothetical protein